MRTSYFAGGCFWCICGAIDGTPGVISVVSGYSGGDEENPSYEDVKAQKTGHRESIKVVFDESIMTYERLLDVFFDNIDPFDAEGQFIDRGRSYTAAVYYRSAEEREAAEKKIAEIEAETGKKVRVAVEPFKSFYEAEERHIDFHKKNPELYEKELAESGRRKLSGDFLEMTGAPENEEKEGKTMDVVKRFIEYVKIATMSDESSENTPSSEIQRNLGKKLEAELRASGAENVVCRWLESEGLAESIPGTGGVYLVPAMTGLGAPWWDMYSRGTLVGMTRGTGRAHIVRAALEAIAYQSEALMQAMIRDSGQKPEHLQVDGGASANAFLMQFQADISQIPVVRPRVLETTALGAALLAGLGCGLYRSTEEMAGLWQKDLEFTPRMDEATRRLQLRGWHRAVERARDWAEH